MITTDLKDSKDVDAHIKKASKAFGSLRQGIFASKSVSFKGRSVLICRITFSPVGGGGVKNRET
eukprot:13027743-Ditylum_brightwellii.AAC.1